MDYHYSTARALDPERVQMEGSPWSPAGEALRGEVPDGTCVAPDPGRVQMEGSPRPAAGEALRGEVPIWTGWVGLGREGREGVRGALEQGICFL